MTERDLAMQRAVGDTEQFQLEIIDIGDVERHFARAVCGQDEIAAREGHLLGQVGKADILDRHRVFQLGAKLGRQPLQQLDLICLARIEARNAELAALGRDGECRDRVGAKADLDKVLVGEIVGRQLLGELDADIDLEFLDLEVESRPAGLTVVGTALIDRIRVGLADEREDAGARVVVFHLVDVDRNLGGDLAIHLVEGRDRLGDLLQCLFQLAPRIVARLGKQLQIAGRVVRIEADEITGPIGVLQKGEIALGLLQVVLGRVVVALVVIEPGPQERGHQQQGLQLLRRGLGGAIGEKGGAQTLVGECVGRAPGDAQLQPRPETCLVERDKLLVKPDQFRRLFGGLGAPDRAQQLRGVAIDGKAFDARPVGECAFGNLRDIGFGGGAAGKHQTGEG